MRRTLPSIETLVNGIFSGNRVVLGQAITLVESVRPEHVELAQEVIKRLMLETSARRDTLRIGVTGAPGVGKKHLYRSPGHAPYRSGRKSGRISH